MQSIKRPVLLEFWGPLFMSTGATSNLVYRLTEKDGGTRIDFKHTVVGSLGQLALHVATIPGNVAQLAAVDTIPGSMTTAWVPSVGPHST